MKKTLMSLAALMMLMAAPVMTSCSNDLDEAVSAEQKGNVVTLTIAPPEAEAETRVSVDPSTLKITGWEKGDKVNLYGYTFDDWEYTLSDAVEFTCIDASAGTFSGTLPEGKSLGNYNFAVYGGTVSIGVYNSALIITPTTFSSSSLKDVVMMAAHKNGDAYQMKIVNNVLKVTNTGSDVTVAWYGGYDDPMGFFKPALMMDEGNKTIKALDVNVIYYTDLDDYKGWDNAPHFTLAGNYGVTYVNYTMPQDERSEKRGLYKHDGTAVVEQKSKSQDSRYIYGKLWSATVNGN